MGIDLPGWLAERLERAYGEGEGGGKGIRPALEGLTAAEAHWRPVPAQHTIAEIAWHMAYWCWKVAHWLDPDAVPDPGGGGGRAGAPPPGPGVEVQRDLGPARGAAAAVIRKFASAALAGRADGPWTKLDVVVDLATHDSYHAAQIFALRRWYAAAEGA